MTKATVTDKVVRGFKPYVNATGVLVRRLAIGGGLFFEVTGGGHRHFIHRFQWRGKGAARAIPGAHRRQTSLADARAIRDADRLLLQMACVVVALPWSIWPIAPTDVSTQLN